MKRQRYPRTRRRSDAARRHQGRALERIYPRVAAPLSLGIALAFFLLSYGVCRAVSLESASPVANPTRAWLLKQARAHFNGKAIDEASAPHAAKTARPT